MTRVAMIGAGYFGQFHYDAWTRMEGAELVGLCELDRAKGQATAEKFSVPQVFDNAAEMVAELKPDLVEIVAPPTAHTGLIRRLAGQVPWIICQKPFCTDLAEARATVREAERRNTRVAVHENFRFQPWYREIARLMAEGAVGEPYQVGFRLRPGDGQGADAYLSRQPYFQKMERFLVHETAIHWIDTFRYLMGEVVAVTARLRRLNPAIAGEDAGFILFEFENGAVGLFDGNRLADHAAENRRLTMGELDLAGSAGTLRLDGDGSLARRAFGENAWQDCAYDWRDNLFGGDCVYLTNRAILDAFRSGEPAETEAGAYIRNIEIEEAVYRSHESGRRIEV